MVLRVPSLLGEGGACHAVVASPYTTGDAGRLAPAVPDYGLVRATGVARGSTPPPATRLDPYRRIALEVRVDADRITLSDPRVSLPSRDTALLAACETSMPLATLPAYASVEACEAEAAPPLPWGECHDHLMAMAADLDSDHDEMESRVARLDRIVSRGGEVWALERQAGQASCLPWRFVPGRRGEYGRMVRNVTRGARSTRTEYAYDYDGATLLVLGPSTTVLEGGDEVSSTAAGCGDRLFVRYPDDRHVVVGGTSWFFDRAHCLAAPSDAPRRGGC